MMEVDKMADPRNELHLQLGEGISIFFTWGGEYSCTPGQPWDGVEYKDNKIIVKAGRKGREQNANWFNDKLMGTKSNVIHTEGGGGELPQKLNFAITGILKVSNTKHVVCIGQGHLKQGDGDKEANNWYIGSIDITADASGRCGRLGSDIAITQEGTHTFRLTKEVFDDTRYWHFRTRLTEHGDGGHGPFLLKGTKQGCSLPADYIYPKNGNTIHWGDATTYLGWYMGVLATEYALLDNEQYKSVYPSKSDRKDAQKKARDELGFALDALDRLDLNANPSFKGQQKRKEGQPCIDCSKTDRVLDGFFIRDDVPDFFKDGDYGYGYLKEHFADCKRVDSDYCVRPDEKEKECCDKYTKKEESQDQVVHLLLGLDLVSWHVPELREKAVESACRIVAHARGGKEWIIRNPAFGNEKVRRGGCAIPLSQGIWKALVHIANGGKFPGCDTKGVCNFEKGCNEVAFDFFSVIDQVASAIAEGGKVTSILITAINSILPKIFKHKEFSDLKSDIMNSDNIHMLMVLAAIGNVWKGGTFKNLWHLARLCDWYAYPLIHALQNNISCDDYVGEVNGDVVNVYSLLRIKIYNMLNAAPEKDFSSGEDTPTGWRSAHRFLKDKEAQQKGGSLWEVNKEKEIYIQYYNGLDYMLLFNLYHMMKRQA